MKKFVLGLVAASLAATPALAAAPQSQRHGQDYGHHQVHRGNQAQQYRDWHRGDRFDSRYARNYRQIDYRHYRGLKAPPRGYRYVQSGNDAVLVGITSGIIAAVVANAIR